VLVRWHPQYEEIRDKPLPNPATLNSAIPRTEWRDGMDGRPEPPWKRNYEIRMIDPVSGKLFTFRNSTHGTRICYERLNERVFVQRTLRGANIIPLVSLEKRPMPTQFGMQSRPHLEPIEYRDPGTSIALPPTPPSPPQLTAPPPAPAPQPAAAEPASQPEAEPRPLRRNPSMSAAPATGPNLLDAMKPVKPIPMEEFINDSLPPFA
jgi:hypothetical protein